uniref:T9SS type A sorting domain-containing protein n=1 Tax=candidate division WOR-3 bacterium TaxID=2052148 RepID=A0A7V3ZUD3_UNCW3
MLVHISTKIKEDKKITFKNFKINNLLRVPLILKDAEEFSLYDATGKLLIEKKNLKGKILIWNGKDKNGNSVVTGVYFIKIKTNKEIITAKAIILR